MQICQRSLRAHRDVRPDATIAWIVASPTRLSTRLLTRPTDVMRAQALTAGGIDFVRAVLWRPVLRCGARR